MKGIELMCSTSGIEIADSLSIEHILVSLANLDELYYSSGDAKVKALDMKTDVYAQALIGLSLKVKTRKY